jgi:hypothetical protein
VTSANSGQGRSCVLPPSVAIRPCLPPFAKPLRNGRTGAWRCPRSPGFVPLTGKTPPVRVRGRSRPSVAVDVAMDVVEALRPDAPRDVGRLGTLGGGRGRPGAARFGHNCWRMGIGPRSPPVSRRRWPVPGGASRTRFVLGHAPGPGYTLETGADPGVLSDRSGSVRRGRSTVVKRSGL